MKIKRVNIHKVIHAANRRGLFVLTTGARHMPDYKHEFSDRQTGKWVLTYYPNRQFWTTPAAPQKGNATDYQEALAVAYDARL